MLKLVVLSVLFVVAAARPSIIGSPLIYGAPPPLVHEPVLARVGSVVKSIPTAVSHQSQSVVHSSAHAVEDVYAPVVSSYAAAPVLHSYSSAPYAAPLSYAAADPWSSYASPLSYASNGVW